MSGRILRNLTRLFGSLGFLMVSTTPLFGGQIVFPGQGTESVVSVELLCQGRAPKSLEFSDAGNAVAVSNPRQEHGLSPGLYYWRLVLRKEADLRSVEVGRQSIPLSPAFTDDRVCLQVPKAGWVRLRAGVKQGILVKEIANGPRERGLHCFPEVDRHYQQLLVAPIEYTATLDVPEGQGFMVGEDGFDYNDAEVTLTAELLDIAPADGSWMAEFRISCTGRDCGRTPLELYKCLDGHWLAEDTRGLVFPMNVEVPLQKGITGSRLFSFEALYDGGAIASAHIPVDVWRYTGNRSWHPSLGQ